MKQWQARVSLWILFALQSLLFSSFSIADPQSKSFSHWSIVEDRASTVITISRVDLYALLDSVAGEQSVPLWQNRAQQNLRVSSAAQCTLVDNRILPSNVSYLRLRLEWQCSGPMRSVASVRVSMNELFSAVPSHMHFANFYIGDVRQAEKLFSSADRDYEFSLSGVGELEADTLSVFFSYFRFGFEHILIGFDHLAFLLSLFLLRGSIAQLLWVVSGFTLGHSITLSLNVLGLLEPNVRFTEALIGLSIALVAVENIAVSETQSRAVANTFCGALLVVFLLVLIYPESASFVSLAGIALFSWCYLQLSDSPSAALRYRPALTAGFGLIHGFGFAGVLLEVGLPAIAQTTALVGFNLGVELGQAVIVSMFIAGAVLLKTFLSSSKEFASEILSAVLCGLGVYWFFQRLFF